MRVGLDESGRCGYVAYLLLREMFKCVVRCGDWHVELQLKGAGGGGVGVGPVGFAVKPPWGCGGVVCDHVGAVVTRHWETR